MSSAAPDNLAAERMAESYSLSLFFIYDTQQIILTFFLYVDIPIIDAKKSPEPIRIPLRVCVFLINCIKI